MTSNLCIFLRGRVGGDEGVVFLFGLGWVTFTFEVFFFISYPRERWYNLEHIT